MSAATADMLREIKGLVLYTDKRLMAQDIIYRGAALCRNAAGYEAPVTAASGDVFNGIARETVDNSAGDAGDKSVEFHFPVLANWDCSGLAQSDVRGDCWLSDDHTVTTTPGNCYAGKIHALDGSTRCWVNHLYAIYRAETIELADDTAAVFGTDSDGTILYDETTDDALEITCAAITLAGAVTVTSTLAVSGHLTMANTKDILPATAKGSDLGSATAEWGDIFVGDDKGIYFGDGQDGSILYDETTDDALEITCAAITLAGAVSVTGHLTMANTKDILPATAKGSDLGSATAEWGNIYVGDDVGAYFGSDQDASIIYDETTDDALEITCAAITLAGAVTVTGALVAASADLGTTCEANAYTVGGVAGIDHGPADITSITIVKGIVTAVTSA